MYLLYVQCTRTHVHINIHVHVVGHFYMYNVHLVHNFFGFLLIKNSHLILTDLCKFLTFDHCMLHDKCMYMYFILFFIF